ncbi:MAG: TIM barrel protein [archaeon]
MIFNTNYYHSLDQNYFSAEKEAAVPFPQQEQAIEGMQLNEIGTSTNPMEHVLNSVQAKIKEGAGKIEFSFMGKGKSNSQQPSPEAFGSQVREDIRALMKINEMETSTHAALHGESLAGLGREGFERKRQEEALKEIKRAIDFAGTATRGGAIVFHTGEWMRPITDIKDTTGAKFSGYAGENEDARYYYVDERTGQVMSVNKEQRVFLPKFKTNDRGEWVDVNGRTISHDAPVERLFDRVPEWNSEGTNFKVEEKDWRYFEEEAKRWNESHPGEKPIAAGQMMMITQLQNRALQAKGNSLFHARMYEDGREDLEQINKALEFYNDLDERMPEDQKWQLMTEKGFRIGANIPGFNSQTVSTIEFLKKAKKQAEDNLRHIHESSANADATAMESMQQVRHMKPIEEYGIKRTAETIGKAGIVAMHETERQKKHLTQPIFVAPENYDQEFYGSHPQEVREVVEESRKAMQQQLVKEGYGKEEAKELAAKHIKATIDIGHLNMWKQHMEAKAGESPTQRDARFKKWVLAHAESLAKDGIIGHVHLADNFGYDDEHLSPGQGNAPIKEFIEVMRKHGIKDFVAEAGSFNGTTVLQETWAQFNSPIYGIARSPGFGSVRQAHFGYSAPPNYIVGAYVPSNEWKMWSEVQLE